MKIRREASAQLISLARSQLTALDLVPDTFVQLAQKHGLLGLMVEAGGPLRTAALPRYTRLLARQEVMVGVLRRVLGALDTAGVAAAILKGPRIANELYESHQLRTFTDVDVLVRPLDVDRALEVVGRDPAFVDAPTKWPRADKRNVLLNERGVEFNLDLHWDLFSYSQLRSSAGGATDWAWSLAVRQLDEDLGPHWVLPGEAEIAFLCAHSILDHRFRLILFRDLAEACTRFDRWDELLCFSERWGLRAVTYAALFAMTRITGAQLDEVFQAKLRPNTPMVGALEALLPRIDPVTFDGHGIHPLNLVAAMLADDTRQSLRRLAEAPPSLRRWRSRIKTTRASRYRRLQDDDRGRTMVLLVSGTRRRGGEVFGSALARGFSERGWSVKTVALHGDTGGPFVETDLILRPDGRPGKFDFATIARLRRLVLTQNPDVVFANGGSTLRYAVLALRTVRRRPQLVYSSIGEPAYWLRGPLHRIMQGWLHRSTDLVLAVSEATRRQITSLFGVPAHRATVAHTGVAPEFFEVRRRSPEPPFHLLFLGSLSTEKDPLAALEVAASVSAAVPVRIRFVGSGPLSSELEARARVLNFSDQVELVGSVADVQPHLEWADLLLMTSRTEGFPGVVLEAAAAGVPTVGFDVGGIRETMLEGTTGLLADRGDIDSLAGMVEELVENPNRLVVMGANARELTRRQFPLDKAVDWYVRVVTGVCRSGSAG